MCKDCHCLLFTDRKIEGAKKVSDDSIQGKVGAVYLMAYEVVAMLDTKKAITKGGTLVRVI